MASSLNDPRSGSRNANGLYFDDKVTVHTAPSGTQYISRRDARVTLDQLKEEIRAVYRAVKDAQRGAR